MLRFYVLSMLLSFNAILSTNLENYMSKHHSQVIQEKVFEKHEVDLLDSCFSDSWPTVIVGAMLINKRLLQLITKKTIYLLDTEKKETEKFINKNIAFTPEKYYNASVTATKFVIIMINTKTLQNGLNKLKNSAFWNIYGYFLVINVKDCQLVYSHSKIIWEFNILNAAYCCYHPTQRVYFYIFNPFNENAPKSWENIGIVYQKNKHPMRIFRKPAKLAVSEDVTNCQDFLFEKAKSLSGYPLKVAEINEFVPISDASGKIHEKNIFDLSQKSMRLIWTQLGATVDYAPITQDELGTLESNGSSSGVVSQVLQGLYECRSDVDYHRGFWQHEVNTYILEGICYTTRKDSIPITVQLGKAFSLRLRIMYLIFFGIVTCIYVYWMKGESAEVALDILRAAVGQSMICKPQNQHSSFIFAGIMFISMIVTLELQSLLNAIVTASLTVGKDISSSDDIIRYNFQAYGDPYYSQYFDGTPLENKISPVTGFTECLQMMRENSSFACVDDCMVTRYSAQEDNELHVTKDEMFSRYDVVFFRHDSPFRKKYQSLCLTLLESGITQNMQNIEKSQYKKLYGHVYTNIRIHQLRSAFYVLFVLLILSLIIFIVESVDHYFRRLIK